MRRLTRDELSQFDGRGVVFSVACEGKVHDVSGSFIWKQGRHRVTHRAGQDLTAVLNDAPHGVQLLERFPVVGELAA